MIQSPDSGEKKDKFQYFRCRLHGRWEYKKLKKKKKREKGKKVLAIQNPPLPKGIAKV